MICNLNVQIWLFASNDLYNFLDDTCKLDEVLHQCLMIKLAQFGNDIDKVIEFVELEFNGQLKMGDFEKLWSLYLVKRHTNGGNFNDDHEFLVDLLRSIVRNLIIVNKIITHQQINGTKTMGLFLSNLDLMLEELSYIADRKCVADKWVGLLDTQVCIKSNQVDEIYLKTIYILREAKQEIKMNVQSPRGSSDITSDEEENEVCKYIRMSSLEDLPFTTHTMQSCNITCLPTYELFKQFKKLKYPGGLKYTIFNDFETNNNVFGLFHGPPGSGKTSLAQGVSNILTINNEGTKYGVLIELSCASVLSKYMNESDKNIDALFKDIESYMDRHCKHDVYLIIDEIETLVRDRRYLLSSTSPNSSLQMVNTMLVCLDRVKKYPQLKVFTTSNLIQNIDYAFIDRVGSIYQIDTPSVSTIEKLLIHHLSIFSSNRGFDIGIVSKVAQILQKMGASGRSIARSMKSSPMENPNEVLESVLQSALKRCRDAPPQ